MNAKVKGVALGLAGTAVLALAGCSASPAASPAAVSGGGATGTAWSAGTTSGAAATATRAATATARAAASGSGSTAEKKGSTSDVITFPPGGAASVVAWYHGRGGTEFTSLTTTLDKATRAETKGGVKAYAQTCDQIKSAAQAAQAAPPMPLASVAQTYSSALTQYVTSATQCQQALASGDSASLNSAVNKVEANSVALNRAAAVLIAALADG